MKRLVACLSLAAATAGCEPKETDTELCREVYGAWCERAHQCDAIEELNACLVYYFEDCRLRRLHQGVAEPSEAALAACVSAIGAMSCDRLDPTGLPECPFLVQPPPDAGPDAADGDADADADAEAEADAPDAG